MNKGTVLHHRIGQTDSMRKNRRKKGYTLPVGIRRHMRKSSEEGGDHK